MLKLHALSDGQNQPLECLGVLCPVNDDHGAAVRLCKKITLPGMGSYQKELTTPLYSADTLQQYALSHPGWSFVPSNCLGVLCSTLQARPDGYVTRKSGVHVFCLPVYKTDRFYSLFYRIAGYMATEGGFVAVACRRTRLWVTLGLLAAAAYVLGYLMLNYGTQGAINELVRFLADILTTV